MVVEWHGFGEVLSLPRLLSPRVTFHSQPQKSSLCIYSQMAIGLVFELGLDKPAPPDLSMTVSNSNAVGHMPGLKASISTLRTMNERRAVLSCFVLTSM
jgi:hypothetical protein